MYFGRCKRIGFAALVLVWNLPAQRPAPPPARNFDVVSIHLVPPNTPPTVRDVDFTPILPGGRYIDSRASLFSMIAFACNLKDARQLEGLPNWAKDQTYSVTAKPTDGFPALPPGENREQVRLMVRAMLADRFHLKVHSEARRERVFKMEIARAGVKIKEVDPPVPPAKEGHVSAAMLEDGGIRMIASKSTMEGLARTLTLLMDRTVVDETGLKGYYDFDVNWSGPGARDGQAPETQFGGPELVGLLISNLQNWFGLHLASATGQVERLVVDHVEPPTNN
jgi:uncharacterized protein (TIGR03435 family)